MKRMALGLVALPLVVAIAILTPNPAGAASAVTGLSSCAPSPACHLGPIHDSYPNYRSVCADQDCAFVAAANLIQITTGLQTSAATLKTESVRAGQVKGSARSVSALWSYWTQSGIGGVYATAENIGPTDKRDLEKEVLRYQGLVVKAGLSRDSYLGTTRFASGVVIMIVDGFTPRGPLVVYQGRTIQMTWAQWRADVTGLWHVATSFEPAPTPPPAASLTLSVANVPVSGSTVTLTFASTNATSCTLSATPTLWAASAATTSCNGTYQFAVGPSSVASQWTITFRAAEADGQAESAIQTLTQDSPGTPSAANVSTNWSGYVVPSTSALITEVQGSFTVPTLDCTDPAVEADADAATWVGIGGVPTLAGTSSGALLQTGVASECEFGAQVDAGWFELYPSNPNYAMNYSAFPVLPGDQINASVYETDSGQWITMLSDVNSGLSGVMETGGTFGVGTTSTINSTGWTDQGSTADLSYSGGYSAEWIVEDPGAGASTSLAPFANFGAVTWSDLACSLTTWSLDQSETTAMVQNGLTLATPSSASTDGFTDVYTGP